MVTSMRDFQSQVPLTHFQVYVTVCTYVTLQSNPSILFYLEFGKEITGYGVTRTIHFLEV